MSVIIRGIEKHENCIWDDEQGDFHNCPLLDHDDSCKLQDCTEDKTWADQMRGCPLIEIPKGARLIDADMLYDRIIQKFDVCDDFLEMLEEAPTIFEED